MKYISFLFFLAAFLFLLSVPASASIKATSSTNVDTNPAQLAVDGDQKTRWTSASEDNQWWQGDFDQPETLCGLILSWEYAFGEKYAVSVKTPSGEWKKVYETSAGDGNTDYIFFDPVQASSVRLECLIRGTGWAFSIWEIGFLNTPAPSLDMKKNGNLWELKFPWKLRSGGIYLTFSSPVSKFYIEASTDGINFQKVFEGSGRIGENPCYFSSCEISVLRIYSDSSMQITGYELKGSEEKLNMLKLFLALAKENPDFYPLWLSRKQEFFTVTGNPGGNLEALISEFGLIEPYKNGFSVMPFIYDGKELISPYDCNASQSLKENFLPVPTVSLFKNGLKLDISSVGSISDNVEFTAVRYCLENKGKKDFSGKIFLSFLPLQLNPTWQHGGFSPISSVQCLHLSESSIRINRKKAVCFKETPDNLAVFSSESETHFSFMKKGLLPETVSAENTSGTASAAASYSVNLKPGEVFEFTLFFPDPEARTVFSNALLSFSETVRKETDHWKKLIRNVEISIPETRLTDVLYSNLAYIMINKDNNWIKPGSRNYSHSWVRDGALTSLALLQMGMPEPAREWIYAISGLMDQTGYVPFLIFENGNHAIFEDNGSPEGKELDSQGEYAFAVKNYYAFTKDRRTLKRYYTDVQNAVCFAEKLRVRSKSQHPETSPDYGIMPGSNSHEGYFPGMHSYWDDFFVLKGYKDALYLAEVMKDRSSISQLDEQICDFRKCLYTSINRVIDDKKLDYIPGCTEKGDFDATSTAIAVMACGEQNYLPEKQLKNTFEKYYAEFHESTKPGKERTFTPYEVRTANAFVRMGHRNRALEMLRYFTKDSVRPHGFNHMAEVVYADPRKPSYIGDMPHTWVGSGYISAVRTLLAFEDNDTLVLCAGIDPAWISEGVSVENLPTAFGSISFSLKQKKGKTVFKASGNACPENGFVLRIPVDGKEINFIFSQLPYSLEM